MNNQNIVLKFSCDDKPGIVAAVATFFSSLGYNIKESSQFEDTERKRFFMRTEFEPVNQPIELPELRAQFEGLAKGYDMNWDIQTSDYRPRLVLAVSKWGHCLNNLLNSWKTGGLPVDITGVVSNHDDMRDQVEWYGLPYHHFPVTADTKAQQEAQILAVMDDTNADLLVLARYMQILSEDLCRQLNGRAINIHHSFLPGFKGAKPYHQAHARGVKIIGATAHYVTSDLDEGPIIEQSVERVSHANSADELVEIGRDIEATVLNRAVKWHAQSRVMLNGSKTIVFRR
jgi:formyltetrahydrofolate deformylase